MEIVKFKSEISFFINNLKIFKWEDDGEQYGPVLPGGKIGFRQMAPLTAAYSNLKINQLIET